MMLDDSTVVKEYDPPRHLRLRARAWPAGEAEVALTVTPTATGVLVVMTEDATAGPGRLVPGPLRQALLGWRNTEALTRLQLLAEGRK